MGSGSFQFTDKFTQRDMRHNLSNPSVLLRMSVVYGITALGLSFYVWHLSTGSMPDRVVFAPFGLYDIYWYGLILLIAILLGVWVSDSLPIQDSVGAISFWQYPVSMRQTPVLK